MNTELSGYTWLNNLFEVIRGKILEILKISDTNENIMTIFEPWNLLEECTSRK